MQTRISKLAQWIVLAAAIVVTGASSLLAQTNTTALSGVVTDATGAVLPGVAVSIKNPSTGETKTTGTKSKGEFDFEQLLPGSYEVHVVAKGFSEEVERVELLVATPLKLNFKMTVGTSEVVEVSTGLAALNTSDATLGKAFDSQQIQSLPYLANNVNYLLSLQPGVLALDPGATSGGFNTDTRTGIVNGARQDQTNLTLDGVDNNDPENGFAFVGILRSTRESVEEFRVTTTNANADAGRSSGGQVSVTTRSGTNTVHGSAYYFYRGGVGAGNNWFNKQTQFTTAEGKGLAPNALNVPAKILQDTYGASLGLPLLKNKLFFFGAYEGFKQATDTIVTQTVPSILNPTTGVVSGLYTGNVVFPSCPTANSTCLGISPTITTITPNQILSIDQAGVTPGSAQGTNAAALAYFKQFPLANSTGGGDGYNTGTYVFPSPQPNHQITNVARLDYVLNPKQTLFVRGTLQSDNISSALQFPGLAPNSRTFSNNKGLAVGHIWQLSNSFTNNFRFGYSRQGNSVAGAGAIPYVSFSAFSNLTGTTTSSRIFVTTDNYVDDATFIKGRHNFQFGANDRYISNSRYASSTLYPNASVSASLLATAAIAGTGVPLDPTNVYPGAGFGLLKSFKSSYNNDILANVGGITSATSYTNFLIQNNQLAPAPTGTVPTHVYNSFEQEYYFQDQWKATERLTLTGGLRYTYLGVPYEIAGQQVAPNINLGTTFLQNRIAAAAAGTTFNSDITINPGGQANGAPNLWTPQKLNFAPRVSFAYATADNKTSIRGGFALAYDHFGDAVINAYDSGGAFALNRQNPSAYPNTTVLSPFTGYNNVPGGTVAATSQQFPIDPAQTTIQSFGSSFKRDIDANLKTPYAETFNLSVQREVTRGMTLTASYVGRLGRHVLNNLDVAQPNNLYDPTSGLSYFQAAQAYAKMVDAGVSVANVPNSGYFQDIFPNASYKASNGVTYKGAQAYYASFAVDRATGNETNTLYNFDTTQSYSPGGASILRYFYPQYSSIFVQASIATSNYNAAQVSLRHTFRYGNEYDFNYSYSKSLDFGSSPERSGGNTIINTFNPSQMYAVSDFDVRHNITANYGLAMPFGKGQPLFANNRLVDAVIGGFRLNGTVHYSTGFPWSANDSGNYGTNFDVSSNAIQIAPLRTGGHQYTVINGVPFESAIKNGASPTTLAQALSAFRLAYPGESGQRNELRADGYFSLDDGISKSFHTFREQQFKLSVEVFNVLNDSRFGSNSGTVTGTSASTSSGLQTSINSAKFGQYSSILVQPRQMQFSGKYTF